MSPEAKKQLEGFARDNALYADRISHVAFEQGVLAGAQAAWDLAVKHERERSIGILVDHFMKRDASADDPRYRPDYDSYLRMAHSILTPAKESE